MKFFYPIGGKGRETIAEKLTEGSLLDVACGTGTLMEIAHEKGLECHGIDISEGMLAQARGKLPEAGLSQASFYALPYPGGRFDTVAATNALSADYIDARKVLAEMIRVCKVGGWIYIAEWPQVPEDSLAERLLIWFASLNEDAPKDYFSIFRALGYEPKVAALSRHYHVYWIKKHERPKTGSANPDSNGSTPR